MPGLRPAGRDVRRSCTASPTRTSTAGRAGHGASSPPARVAQAFASSSAGPTAAAAARRPDRTGRPLPFDRPRRRRRCSASSCSSPTTCRRPWASRRSWRASPSCRSRSRSRSPRRRRRRVCYRRTGREGPSWSGRHGFGVGGDGELHAALRLAVPIRARCCRRLIVAGFGMGCIIRAGLLHGHAGVERFEAGVASATVNTSQQVGRLGRDRAAEHDLREAVTSYAASTPTSAAQGATRSRCAGSPRRPPSTAIRPRSAGRRRCSAWACSSRLRSCRRRPRQGRAIPTVTAAGGDLHEAGRPSEEAA